VKEIGRIGPRKYFPIIKQAGFSLIRVPIRWAGPCRTRTRLHDLIPLSSAGSIGSWRRRQKNGLIAILDYHNDDDLMHHPDANADRFVTTWKQIAEHYKDAPTTILFEC